MAQNAFFLSRLLKCYKQDHSRWAVQLDAPGPTSGEQRLLLFSGINCNKETVSSTVLVDRIGDLGSRVFVIQQT